MKAKYLLVSTCDREILVEAFASKENALAQMYREMAECGIPADVLNEKEYDEWPDDFAFGEHGGYVNGRYECDWLLTEIPDPQEDGGKTDEPECFRDELEEVIDGMGWGEHFGEIARNDEVRHAVWEDVRSSSAWEDDGKYNDDDIRMAFRRTVLSMLCEGSV